MKKLVFIVAFVLASRPVYRLRNNRVAALVSTWYWVTGLLPRVRSI